MVTPLGAVVRGLVAGIKVLAKDLTAHLVYGLTTATTYKVLGSRDD